jgi:hypothetical protein
VTALIIFTIALALIVVGLIAYAAWQEYACPGLPQSHDHDKETPPPGWGPCKVCGREALDDDSVILTPDGQVHHAGCYPRKAAR